MYGKKQPILNVCHSTISDRRRALWNWHSLTSNDREREKDNLVENYNLFLYKKILFLYYFQTLPGKWHYIFISKFAYDNNVHKWVSNYYLKDYVGKNIKIWENNN